MALSRHNAATGQSSSTNTVSATLTAAIGEIIVIQVSLEDVSGAVKTVTGVSDGTANVYAKRFSASATGAAEPAFAASEGFEVWWAYVANTLTTATVSATFSAGIDDAVAVVAGYQGFTGTAYQTNPWDTNASLPKTAQSAAETVASATGISTTSTAGILLAGLGSCHANAPALPAAPTGFSLAGQLLNGGASNAVHGNLWDEVYSSAQSSITVTTTGNNVNGWIFWVDALTIPAAATTNPSRIIQVRQSIQRAANW